MSDNDDIFDGLNLSWSGSPNRYVCSVLDEMRKTLKLLHKDEMVHIKRASQHLALLVEEAQTLVNRMESALEDWNDINSLRKDVHKLKIEKKRLKEEIKTYADKKEQTKS